MSEELPYVKPHTFRNVVELCNRGGGGAGSGGGGPLALICVLVRLRHFLVALACCNFSFVPQIMPNRPTRLRLQKSKLTPTRLRLEKSKFRALVLKAKLNQGCNTTMLPNKRLKLHVDTTTTTTTTNTNTTDATACVDISWVCISRFLTVHSLSCLALSSKQMTKLFAEELKLRKRKLLLEQVLKLEGVMRYRVGRFLTAHSMTQLTRSSRGLAMIFCWPRNRRLYRERLFRRHSAKHAWKVVRSSGMLSIDSERRLAETSGFILRRWGPKPPQGRWARWS